MNPLAQLAFKLGTFHGCPRDCWSFAHIKSRQKHNFAVHGKLFSQPLGVCCTLLGPPNCHIMQNMNFPDVQILYVSFIFLCPHHISTLSGPIGQLESRVPRRCQRSLRHWELVPEKNWSVRQPAHPFHAHRAPQRCSGL